MVLQIYDHPGLDPDISEKEECQPRFLRKIGELENYLSFFVKFTHENDIFSNKKGDANPLRPPLDSPLPTSNKLNALLFVWTCNIEVLHEYWEILPRVELYIGQVYVGIIYFLRDRIY